MLDFGVRIANRENCKKNIERRSVVRLVYFWNFYDNSWQNWNASYFQFCNKCVFVYILKLISFSNFLPHRIYYYHSQFIIPYKFCTASKTNILVALLHIFQKKSALLILYRDWISIAILLLHNLHLFTDHHHYSLRYCVAYVSIYYQTTNELKSYIHILLPRE